MAEEIWKEIPGFDGYMLSNMGRLRSSMSGSVREVKTFIKLCNDRPYLSAVIRKKGIRKTYTFYIHRLLYTLFIGSIPDNMVIDHKDRNSLNNSLDNLRLCTQKDNTCNSKPKRAYTKYKGVSSTKQGTYSAHISNRYRKLSLGIFETAEEAALAYNKAAKDLFGEFAYLNNVDKETN